MGCFLGPWLLLPSRRALRAAPPAPQCGGGRAGCGGWSGRSERPSPPPSAAPRASTRRRPPTRGRGARPGRRARWYRQAVARVDRRGEAEVRRKTRRDEPPRRLARIAPVDLFVYAHEAQSGLLGMREQLVDAAEDVGSLAEIGLVVLGPGRAAVGRRVHAADADADRHLLRILRVD